MKSIEEIVKFSYDKNKVNIDFVWDVFIFYIIWNALCRVNASF